MAPIMVPAQGGDMALGQLMVGLDGPVLTEQERVLLDHPQVAGVILFARNYRNPSQLAALTTAIKACRSPAPLITVDQEGGRVQRFRDGFTRLPPMGSLGRLHDRDPGLALEHARSLGWLMAAELLAVGVDLSFAPVLDLDRGISGIIGDRAFHQDPDTVVDLAGAWIDGMHKAGMAVTGKHFPGHGSVAPDSHLELPVDNRPELELRGSDIRPFEVLLERRRLEAVMTAHVVYTEADSQPASFSSYWITSVLRHDLGFDGVIVADDLGMEGAAAIGDCAARARVALEAGADLVMLCNQLEQTGQVLAALPEEPDAASSARLERLRGKFGGLDTEALARTPEWAHARDVAAELAGPGTHH